MITSYVPCTQNASVVIPVFDEQLTNVVDIDLARIVAWRIETLDKTGTIGVPVITEPLPRQYAIYFADTDSWTEPDVHSGKGLDELLEYVKGNW